MKLQHTDDDFFLIYLSQLGMYFLNLESHYNEK